MADKGNKGKLKKPFPAKSIEDCREVAEALKEKNGGKPWAPSEVAAAIGIAKGNPRFFYMASSSVKYGLTDGGRDSKEIGLTELGKSLVYPASSEDEARTAFEAFRNIEIFAKVFDHYNGGKLPEAKFVNNTLQATFGLDPSFHSDFHDIYQSNLNYLSKLGMVKEVASDAKPYRTLQVGEATSSKGGTKVAFVAMPFSEKSGLYAEGYFDEVLKRLIVPAASEAGFNAETASKSGSEVIQATVVRDLLDADLVVVDLTEHNPNVLFELGMRIAFNKPVCLIRASGTAPIFDVDNMLRVYDYNANLWPSTVESDIPELSKHIEATWNNRERDQSYLDILKGSL